MKIYSTCPTCNGVKEVFDGKNWKTCPTCGGSGEVVEET